MPIKKRFSEFLVILPLLLSLPARADDPVDQDLPKVQLLACQGQCANFVPAKFIKYNPVTYPRDQIGWTRIYSEANLKLLYTVGPDGKVRDDVLVLYLIGPREFADVTIQQVKSWTFEPAMSNGKPVAQSRMLRQTYEWEIRNPLQVRSRVLEVTQGWNAFNQLTAEGKPDEARGKLEDVLKNVRLTFADRTAVASALADLAYKRKDYLEARRLAIMATTLTVPKLPPSIQLDAWKNRIKADLALREISDVLESVARLQEIPGASDPSLPDLIETVRKTANAEPILTAQAQIPPVEDGDVYTFLPYRRTFTFQKIEGSLQKFVLTCNQATMESDITTTAQWRIPDKWDGCSVHVRGTPGTKFLVVQPRE
jgi:hypothetical protein